VSPPARGWHRFRASATVYVWLALALGTIVLARENASAPGLYYDEAVFAGTAKEFVTGRVRGQHMPGFESVTVFGRPFPLLIQSYLGALKSWMLIPVFAVFGSSLVVLRFATLAWSLAALLVCMLWLRRWQGDLVAIIAGSILAFDPTWFFLSILDWGVATPSFLCRFVCFYFVLVWYRDGKLRCAFLAAFFAGLGIFNKIDFVVHLAGVGLAAVLAYWPGLKTRLRDRPVVLMLALCGLVVGACPILFKLPAVVEGMKTGNKPAGGGEMAEKVNTLLTMYDGSYFYRAIDCGAVFKKLSETTSAAMSPFGVAVAISLAVLLLVAWRKDSTPEARRGAAFVLMALVLVTAGVFVMPRAVRIHHAVLVFPFPHLAVAMAAAHLLERATAAGAARYPLRVAVWAGIGLLLAGQTLAVLRTQRLIDDTGGRGRWAECFDQFCADIKDRDDLTVMSLDWGFNEQLLFLTDRPTLVEPIWNLRAPEPLAGPTPKEIVYLLHPPEYALFELNNIYLERITTGPGAGQIAIRPYRDRQGRVAFYAVRPARGRGAVESSR
jgi:hypothetical protein